MPKKYKCIPLQLQESIEIVMYVYIFIFSTAEELNKQLYKS